MACAVAFTSSAMVPGASAQDNSAHALAEKFSRATQDEERAEQARRAEAARKAAAEQEAARKRAEVAARKAQAEAERRRAEAQRRADEAEMLRQARAEAEARRAAELKAKKEREERAQAQRLAREAEENRRKAEQARLEAEREAARAQAVRLAREVEQRRQADARRAEEARKVEAARLAREVEEQRRADERKAAAEAQRIREQAELEAKRQQELSDIAEKFRLAREVRERAAREKEERARLAKQEELQQTRHSLGGPRPDDNPAVAYDRAPERATVLLIVEPRRRGKAPNPVLCIEKSCYVSSGADDSAQRVSRTKALGPGNTMGRRAGPCNKQRTCVYRNVYVGDIASIQPVDLGFWGHKRHDIYTARPDKSCTVIKGRLSCSSPIIGHGYRAWIVPEQIAARAGADALEHALQDGLPATRSAAVGGWTSTVHNQDR